MREKFQRNLYYLLLVFNDEWMKNNPANYLFFASFPLVCFSFEVWVIWMLTFSSLNEIPFKNRMLKSFTHVIHQNLWQFKHYFRQGFWKNMKIFTNNSIKTQWDHSENFSNKMFQRLLAERFFSSNLFITILWILKWQDNFG